MAHPSLLKRTAAPAVPGAFARYRPNVEQTLKDIVGRDGGLLYRMLRYHLGWEDEHGEAVPASGGKAVRSTLCLLAAEALSGSHAQALPGAAALELVHNFSLIHDDIQDGSPERRHRPTVWNVWGEPQAINAGDAMYTLARLALLRLDGGLLPGKVLAAARLLDDSCLRMIEGQCLDLQYQRLDTVTSEQYLDMIGKKTAALLACSLELGALLGGGGEDTRQRFHRGGYDLGLAFQMRDDLLGIWGEGAITGKPTGEDIARKKKSLPVVYGLNTAARPQRERLTSVYAQPNVTGEGVAEVVATLEEVGAREHVQALVEYHASNALQAIAPLLPGDAARDLRDIVAFLTGRDY